MIIEKTLFIIKPEAFQIRSKIKKYIIGHSELKIIDSRITTLSEADVDQIYKDDIGTELMSAAKQHLVGRPVEICVLEGEDAIEKFLDLAGRNFDGSKCAVNTVRYIFGQMGVVHYGDVTYYLNAIHKASPNEIESALDWFSRKKY